jgi:Protein of unknown function (DUF732)
MTNSSPHSERPVSPIPDPDRAIAAGKAVCTMAVDQGMRMENVIIAIHNSNPRLSWDEAAKFTAIAANTYCPQTQGDNSGNAV